jgi:GT2 family glycosyltransferase
MRIDLPRSDAPRVSVIVVATASLDLLQACLASLARFAPGAIPFETVLVLNEANPDTQATVRATVTGANITSSVVNLGFARAANRGRSLARGELLLILHDDAEVEAGWMEALVETADAHPEAGAVGGKVLHPDGRLQNAGMILWRDGYTSPPWTGEAPPPDSFDRLRAVDYCGTSSLLVRAAAWDAIGGLEEKLYPLYYVDVDLSMALRRLGFVVLYQPASRIHHHQGGSRNLRYRVFASQRNRLVFMEKWGNALQAHDERSPSTIEAAMVRAEAFAAECRRRGPPWLAPLQAGAPVDSAAQELQAYERNRQFMNDYVKHLTEAVEMAEKKLLGGGKRF